jgi:hypothetical protein
VPVLGTVLYSLPSVLEDLARTSHGTTSSSLSGIMSVGPAGGPPGSAVTGQPRRLSLPVVLTGTASGSLRLLLSLRLRLRLRQCSEAV